MSQNANQKDLIVVRGVLAVDRDALVFDGRNRSAHAIVHYCEFVGRTAACGWGEPSRGEGGFLGAAAWSQVTCMECLRTRRSELTPEWEAAIRARVDATAKDYLQWEAGGRPVGESPRALANLESLVAHALTDLDALLRKLDQLRARTCTCRPRHTERCPQYEPERP